MKNSTVNVLIVDDRPENRLALKALLDEPGYRLVEAKNGREALQHLLHEDFAMLLLDVRMPEMDGFELASLIRQRQRTQSVPILFLTAEATDVRSMFRGYEIGAVDYLLKPLVTEVVRSKVAVFAELFRTRQRIEEQGKRLLEAEQRESELALLKQKLADERRYRNLADAVPHIVWTAGPDGRVDYFNQRWFEVTGRTRDERDTSWFSVVQPTDLPHARAIWEQSLLAQTPCEFECRIRTAPKGEYRWHLGRALPERDSEGQVVSWLGTLTDIEHQKRAQEILAQFKGTLDAVLDAVFIFDSLSWRLEYVNQGATALLKRSPAQLEQMRTLDLLPEYSEEEFSQLLAALRTGKVPSVAIETHVRPQGGTDVPLELSLQHIQINGGRLVGIGRDMTERKRAERERELLYHEAVDAIRARDEFLSVASHELKTPLTSLRLQLDGLLQARQLEGPRELSSRASEKLQLATRQISRLARLIEELLDVSRLNTGAFRIDPVDGVDLAGIVKGVVSRMGVELGRAGCTAILDAPSPVKGEWDPVRVEEVVMNLLANAMKFGPNRPIEITVSLEDGMARLRVRDHGIGIPKEAQERIFGPFERAVSTHHYGGLGLGLYVVRQVLRAHGGRVRVESGKDEGSTFLVELPVEQPLRVPPQANVSSSDSAGEPVPSA